MSTQITEYSTTEAALQELRQRYKDAKFDVATTAGMTEAKKVRAELRTYRTDLEKRRVEIKAPALERCRLIDDEAKRITAELVALEKPVHEQITGEEDRLAAERQAKIDAENLRRTTIQTKIQKFRQVAGAMVNKTSAEIEETLGKVSAAIIDEINYNEFMQEAEEARGMAMNELHTLLLKAQAAEAEQARIIVERAELEELRTKQAEMQRQIDAQNAAEQNRLAQEREAQQAELLKEKQEADALIAKQQQEAAEKAREQEAIDQAQRAEKQRLERERLVLEEQQLAEADRTKKLLAAKKDTPMAALVEILGLCREGLKPEVALAHIAIIAEANIIEVAKPKRAAKK